MRQIKRIVVLKSTQYVLFLANTTAGVTAIGMVAINQASTLLPVECLRWAGGEMADFAAWHRGATVVVL